MQVSHQLNPHTKQTERVCNQVLRLVIWQSNLWLRSSDVKTHTDRKPQKALCWFDGLRSCNDYWQTLIKADNQIIVTVILDVFFLFSKSYLFQFLKYVELIFFVVNNKLNIFGVLNCSDKTRAGQKTLCFFLNLLYIGYLFLLLL